MYWIRLGRNFYVTNTYLPSSYSKLGKNILLRTRYVATDLVTSQNFQPIRCAFTLFLFGRTRDLILVHFLILSSYGKSFWSFVHVNFYCVGAGISTLISISDWSNPYIFRRKMEKTRSVKEEMEGKLFISRQSRHISFVFIMIKVPFPTLYLY